MASDLFGKKIAVIPHRADKEVVDLREDVEKAFADSEGAFDTGHVAMGELTMSAQPADTNTATIGADVYEFDNNSTFTAGRLQVVIGADAQATLDALVAKINASGTEKVKASKVGTTVCRVEVADKAGGTAVRGAGPSLAVAETITDAADVWNIDNLNESGSGLRQKQAKGKLAATAKNIATLVRQALPFTPTSVVWGAFAASGAPKVTTATVVISGAEVHFDLDVGVTPLVATDVIQWVAYDKGTKEGLALDA